MTISKQNNYAFIDSQNLEMSIKEQGWRLDYRAFRKYLKDKYNVTKAFYFIGYVATNADLYESLQEFGYILVFKPTLEIKGRIKGNVDAELVLHAMIEYRNYDQAVIVSGDGDFFCLVKYLANNLKLCKLIVPNDKKFSSLYRKHTSYIAGVNKLREKLGIKKEA